MRVSYINNTRNFIKHITFIYLISNTDCETKYCTASYNPSVNGVEFQSQSNTKCTLLHSAFLNNECTNLSKGYGVVRLYHDGHLKIDEIYFFQNSYFPMSFHKDSEGVTITLEIGTVYTDDDKFYSATASKLITSDHIIAPKYYTNYGAVECGLKTKYSKGRPKFPIAAALLTCLSKESCEYMLILYFPSVIYIYKYVFLLTSFLVLIRLIVTL